MILGLSLDTSWTLKPLCIFMAILPLVPCEESVEVTIFKGGLESQARKTVPTSKQLSAGAYLL